MTELEVLVLVWAERHFRPYLLEHYCQVYTDHAPLKAMLKARNPSGNWQDGRRLLLNWIWRYSTSQAENTLMLMPYPDLLVIMVQTFFQLVVT